MYQKALEKFIAENMDAINMQRTEMMLRTGGTSLRRIEKSESILYSERMRRI